MVLRVLLALVVSGGLLVAVLWGVDLSAAWARVAAADPGWLLASLAVSFAVLVARSLRFSVLTTRATVGQVTGAVALQNFLVRVTPFRLGELSLPYLLHRTAGEPPGTALVSLLLVRLLELWLLLATAIVSAVLWFGDSSGQAAALAVLVALSLALVGFRYLLRFGIAVARWLAERTGLDKTALSRRVFAQLEEAKGESARLTPAQRWGVGVGSLVVVALQFLLYGCLVAACGLDVHPLQLVVGATAAQVAGALPVLTIGSLGTHESGWVLAFVALGVSRQDAVVTGLFTQVVTLLFAALFALPVWLLGRNVQSSKGA